jgi:nickel-dependent lactate racemase
MRIPFGQGSVDLAFDDGRSLDVVSPKATPPDPTAIRRSIENPVNFKDFESFISDKHKILVVVNDHTRSTPTADALKCLNLRGKEVTTIIASGTHRPPNQSELRAIIGGDAPPYGGKIAIHNCRDKNSLRSLGRTSRGTEVYLNSLLFEADAVIPVTSVEPHYFAGFTGGRKFLLPALAGFDSVATNHCLAAEKEARLLALEGNPVHEDFMETLSMFGRMDDIFSIQLVLNRESQVSYACAGHIIDSFKQAVEHAKNIYVPKIPRKADIVVSVNEPPLDIDLYQSQKALQDVEYAVKQGGIIILISSCREGIGDEHFYKLLTSQKTKANSEDARKFGYHKVVKLTNLLKNAKIFAVTNLPASIPKAIGLTPYQNAQDALADATKTKGKDSEVLVVLDAAITVPVPADT